MEAKNSGLPPADMGGVGCMKDNLSGLLALVVAVCVYGAALALPPVRPVLPPVAHDDTETVTNVPFASWQDCAGKWCV